METISAEQLRELMDAEEGPRVINVLPRKSFDKQHIPGSHSVSQYDEDFLDRIEFLVEDQATAVVVYCNSESCNASNLAGAKLEQAGYTQVRELHGGLAAWRSAGFSVSGK